MYCRIHQWLTMTTIRSRFKLRKKMLEAHQERNYSEEAGLQGEEIARKNLELKLDLRLRPQNLSKNTFYKICLIYEELIK